ncbi:hypothetical protein Y032_0720g1814 [Ancylostoma ceylanicum]|uniref:Uncharacterized protein n=1 Tax=Ancylostoma ceylanicum TaxID=53326 RepID=A0A016WFJ4_9BILA|nr:hypothetical protein Y032_0720g1814 [Ancylostoma ceylanicum]
MLAFVSFTLLDPFSHNSLRFTCAERLSEFCYVPVASNAPFDGLIEEHRIALSDFGLGHFHFSSRLSIRGKIYDLLFLASLEERRGHLT